MAEKRVLKRSSLDSRLFSDNLIGEPSVLEALEGPTAGLPRLIFALATKVEVSSLGELVPYVSVAEKEMVRDFPLDDGTSLIFAEDLGIATFSSFGSQYRIRAIERSDSSWIYGLDDSFFESND
jgi:hypothetical protein